MDTTSPFFKLIFLLVLISSCVSSPKDTAVYNFSFQVQPNSEYAVTYHHINEGKIYAGSETRFITSEAIDTFGLNLGQSKLQLSENYDYSTHASQRFIGCKILTDKDYTPKLDIEQFQNYDAESKNLMKSILADVVDMETIVLRGEIIDGVVYSVRPDSEIMSTEENKQVSDYIKGIRSATPTALHRNLPEGKMMVGDTFFINAKISNALNSAHDIYILKKVKNGIAYFDIEKRFKSIIGAHNLIGQLEYNFTDSLFQYHGSTLQYTQSFSRKNSIERRIKKIKKF